jgi:hypothetical protein
LEPTRFVKLKKEDMVVVVERVPHSRLGLYLSRQMALGGGTSGKDPEDASLSDRIHAAYSNRRSNFSKNK